MGVEIEGCSQTPRNKMAVLGETPQFRCTFVFESSDARDGRAIGMWCTCEGSLRPRQFWFLISRSVGWSVGQLAVKAWSIQDCSRLEGGRRLGCSLGFENSQKVGAIEAGWVAGLHGPPCGTSQQCNPLKNRPRAGFFSGLTC
jgi:hypothetical protein